MRYIGRGLRRRRHRVYRREVIEPTIGLILFFVLLAVLLLASFAHAQAGLSYEYVLVNSCVASVDFSQMDCRGESPTTLQCQHFSLIFKPGMHVQDCLNFSIIRPGQKDTVVAPARILGDKAEEAKLLRLRRPVLDPTFIEDVEEPKQ